VRLLLGKLRSGARATRTAACLVRAVVLFRVGLCLRYRKQYPFFARDMAAILVNMTTGVTTKTLKEKMALGLGN
jgi:hypothetical protein